MPELLRIFFLSHFGLIVKAHPLKNRAYRCGDFIMHNGDYPMGKIRGKNFAWEFTSRIGIWPTFFFGRKLVRPAFLTCMTRWNPGKPFLRIWSVENHLL